MCTVRSGAFARGGFSASETCTYQQRLTCALELPFVDVQIFIYLSKTLAWRAMFLMRGL